LAVPENTPAGLQKRFDRIQQEWRQQRQERVYIVKPNDNLSTIAEQFQVPLSAILIWNRIGVDHLLHPGDRLIIHPTEEREDGP
jgi:hypothetical protein